MRNTSPYCFEPGALAVVAGCGRSGRAAARLLARGGLRVRLLDAREPGAELAREARERGWEMVAGRHEAAQFAGACVVVVSPGVPLDTVAACVREAGLKDIPLIGEMEYAASFAREPIVAITGTSGKTTTAGLAAAMLQEAGKRVFLGGNIGTPLSEYILAREDGGQPEADVLVLEASSFQLQSCLTFRPRVGVLLNLSPNHLDHHKDMAEYAEAKFRLFACQDAGDCAVVAPDLIGEARRRGVAARISSFEDRGRFAPLSLLGAHNRRNCEAAWEAVAMLGVSLKQAQRAARNFVPFPHRLENVGTGQGLTFINDSKSTTVDALKVALESFAERGETVVLLAGGKFKGGDVASLRPLLKKCVRAVALYGGARDVFEAGIGGCVPVSWSPGMEGAMEEAVKAGRPGDFILLSPATASFDQYENYGARGDHFRRLAGQIHDRRG